MKQKTVLYSCMWLWNIENVTEISVMLLKH
jgi:hypothetical protein